MKQSKYRRKTLSVITAVLLAAALLGGCTVTEIRYDGTTPLDTTSSAPEAFSAATSEGTTTFRQTEAAAAKQTITVLDGLTIPAYSADPYTVVHDNIPFFEAADLDAASFEEYSPLDALGRCGAAFACVGTDLMPTEERGSIGQIRPSGWQTVKYDCVDGKYLYNRCHLIGYQLTAENANERNLITGTRYLNVEGMLPFENMVADYVKETGNHVLYRVTPSFDGTNLVADGVLMEAQSVEDDGILFCVFCYNVQPGIRIDYATGSSSEGETPVTAQSTTSAESATTAAQTETAASIYILNTNTMKFHSPECGHISSIRNENKQEYQGSRDDLIAQGYEPCGVCKP